MLMPNIIQGFGLEIALIAVTAYLWMKSLKNRSTATLLAFNRLCSSFMLFLLVNVPVRILDLELASWNPDLVFLFNALFIAYETLTAYEWFIYFLTVQESPSLKNRRRRMLFLFPLVLMLVLLAVSYKTGWLFYVDRDGMYARGSLFFLQLLIPYLYVAASFVSAFLNYKKTNNRRTFAIVLSAFFSSIIASVLQIFYSGSFVLGGFCFAIFLIYIEMYQYEIRQIEKTKSLGEANRKLALTRDKLDETKEELEINQTSLEESLAFTNYFLDTYVSAYYIGLDDLSCKTYKRTKDLEENYPITGNYLTSLETYINGAVHPDDRAELLRILSPAYLQETLKETDSFSYYFRDVSGGTEKFYKVQVIRGADEHHAAFGFVDQTDELREQQSRLLGAIPLSSDILTKANIGLWSFELDEGCEPRMYADEAMLGLIGLDRPIPPEQTYHAWYDNIDPGSYDLVADAVAKMTAGEHAEVQYPWHNPNGQTWIVRCGGVRNPEYTKGIRIEGTHQNVTELLHYDEEQRKREEKQRQDELARVRAEASDKAKTEFLFNMSHDIRTPMNAILGYTDIAMNHIGETERVRDSLGKIKTSGGHLLKLINDILEMSRIEAGKLEIVKAPLNILEAADGVANMSQALADKNDIRFQKIVGNLENPYIYADELHTNQILINIISNAIKYTNPGGKVVYTIEQLGPASEGIARYRFTVSDNGIGMSDEFQKHIFESFSREQTSTVSKLEGTGLGLAIVKKIVDKIGGTIAVRSKLGEGSVFVVEIPFEVLDDEAVKAFTTSQGTQASIAELASFDGMRALLVEDNELNREIATEILEETGLVLEIAEDGAIAVEKVSEKGTGYYDFILMDIQMPVMDGYEATARIRRLPGGSELPIIALSANAFKEDIDKSLASGMSAHVSKPIDIKELLDVMRKLANRSLT